MKIVLFKKIIENYYLLLMQQLNMENLNTAIVYMLQKWMMCGENRLLYMLWSLLFFKQVSWLYINDIYRGNSSENITVILWYSWEQ